MNPVRVLIADDHPPTRADVREALEADPRFVVCGEAPDAPAAVQMALRKRPEVCLLDVRMPGSGIAAAWEITARLPTTRAVMLTVSEENRDLFAALRAGASGYLLKDMDLARLPNALTGVLTGEAAIPRTLVAEIMDHFRDRSPRRRAPTIGVGDIQLTSREWEVLDLLRQGLTTGKIAERLMLSPVTIRTYVHAILRKLRVPDRDAAVRLFEES